jgi:hypothetical protein
LAAIIGLQSPGVAAVTPEVADLNGDGVVNVLDYRLLARRNGIVSGNAGYLEGMDLVPDAVINRDDLNSMRGEFRQAADNSPANTLFGGRVFDGLGNVLQGVKVFVGTGIPLGDLFVLPCLAPTCGVSGPTGQYLLENLPASVHGETQVSFVANAVSDPTPGQLSGEFATIPHQPVFINAGVSTVYRDVPLPERDLTGAQTIDAGNSTQGPDGSLTLTETVEVDNGNTTVTFEVGCNVAFPVGDPSTELSITRVPAASLPVPMPPDLSSTIFVTYQPGGTVMDCPGGTFVTEFGNIDGFPITDPGVTPPGLIPILNGIVGGVFVELAPCAVEDRDGNGVDGDINDVVSCVVPTPFDFAWYHTDIRPPDPCPRTTVIGQVKEFGTNNPVADATVTIPGGTPVTTDAAGNFAIVQISAGPNGPFCTSRPFSLRATATGELSPEVVDTSVSELIPAVPGGTTDLGMIFLGNTNGQVRGRVVKLQRINPELVVQLPGAVVDLTDAAVTHHQAVTDASGNYNMDEVEIGNYNKTMNFTGDVPLPGGGTEEQTLFEAQNGNVAGADVPDVNDFLLTSYGTVRVTVQEVDGTPIPNAEVYLYNDGGTFGLFRVDSFEFEEIDVTGADGVVVFPVGGAPLGPLAVGGETGVPMGPCTLDVYDISDGGTIGHANGDSGCFVNEDGELVEVIITREQPLRLDIINVHVSAATFDDDGDQGTPSVPVAQVVITFDGVIDPDAGPAAMGDGAGAAAVGSSARVFVDLDLDKNPGTGEIGAVQAESGVPTGLGVESSWSCDVDGINVEGCFPYTETTVYAPPEAFIIPEFDGPDTTSMIFLFFREDRPDGLGVGNQANIAVAGEAFNDIERILEIDIAPNGVTEDPQVNTFIDSVFDVPVDQPDPLDDLFPIGGE